MVALVSSSIAQGGSVDSLGEEVRRIAVAHYIEPSSVGRYIVEGWETAVGHLLDVGVLTEEDRAKLNTIREDFNLSQGDLDRHGAYTQIVQAGVLRDVLDGKVPNRLSIEGDILFNLQKSEQLVWVFPDTDYREQEVRREFVGDSTGASVRVARGVYFRASSFKGHPVEENETVHMGTGVLGVTTKHLYFSGRSKSLRIPYTDIVSFDPYSDGIGLHRDATTAKPQSFVTGHGWFTYNLVTNLARV